METLLLDRAPNGVVTLTLNRPEKKNAMNGTMWRELLAVFTEVAGSDTDRVLVITGAGDAFCSGADLSAGPPRRGHPLAAMRHVADVALALHRLTKPVIAKVNGVAAGGGRGELGPLHHASHGPPPPLHGEDAVILLREAGEVSPRSGDGGGDDV